MSAQVPLATYFHSLTSALTLDWPAQEWLPLRLAQSFCPAAAIP